MREIYCELSDLLPTHSLNDVSFGGSSPIAFKRRSLVAKACVWFEIIWVPRHTGHVVEECYLHLQFELAFISRAEHIGSTKFDLLMSYI